MKAVWNERKLNIRERRGNITVFFSIILSTLILLTLSLVYTAREQAIYSCADGVFNLAGDSVLSEYDYYIYKDYDLFLINSTNKELSRDFKTYAGYTLFNIEDVKFSKASLNAGRFSTASLIPVNEQILDYMKSLSGISGLITEDREKLSPDDFPKRKLAHEPTAMSLPSRDLPDKSIITSAEEFAEKLQDPKLIFKSGTDKFLFDSYIFEKFNRESAIISDEHFFRNEVEYIICGELSDKSNKAQVDLALDAIRVGLNLQYLYSSPSKMALIQSASQTLTPGPLGTVTQLGIATVWAGAEAINDVKLLNEGYLVPLIKTDASWAIDLDSLINGYDAEKSLIKPSLNTGRSYEDYLRVLLFVKDDNVKTARILDLIQINMRKNYDADFLIQECATGISIDCEVNGREFIYDKTY